MSLLLKMVDYPFHNWNSLSNTADELFKMKSVDSHLQKYSQDG